MVSSSQLSQGMTVKIGTCLYQVEDVTKVTVTKGSPFIKCTLLDLATGKTKEKNFKPTEKLEDIHLEKRKLEFLYAEGKQFLFLSCDSLDQILVDKKVISSDSSFLKEGVIVGASCMEDQVYAIELPRFLEFMVTRTDLVDDSMPVSNATKTAILETGAQVEVPPFIEVGDVIKIDTQKNEYVQRV